MKHIPHFSNRGDQTHIGMKALGEEPVFHSNVVVYDSHFGAYTEIGANSGVVETTFDDYSYTAGDNQIIYAEVGKFSNIASHVRINPGNHPMERVTLHHMTYRRALYGFGEDDQAFFDWRRSHKCVIGHDTWLGHGVIVMPGVSVGTGAVVGSGAVVTKDIPPYMIAVGVPAKVMRPRFPEPIIESLLRIAWWDWDHATLGARLAEMNDVQAFVEKYG
ncbi:MAG TPA: DapH/DapD/GlmU-related protein [Aggregatilineales bacterium]|nr:DapH/DapD/GlmU-related protein [Aggregatilineales bacterium]